MRGSLTIALLLALCSTARAQDAGLKPVFSLAPREHDVAVIVGIEKYHDVTASEFSASDARAFKDSLVALGFRDTNIQLLINDDATGAGFRKTIERWLPNHVKPESTVVFYYSGHGAPDASNPAKPQAYLLPFDGDPNYLEDTGYKVEALYDKLGKLAAKKVVVVLDACFSGQGDRSVMAKGARALIVKYEPVGAVKPNMAVLTASKGMQMSASDPAVKHGVLTYNLLKALADGRADLYDIYNRIKGRVEDQAKGARAIDQSPQFVAGVAKPAGLFMLADANEIESAKAEYAKANDEGAKKAAEAAAFVKQKDDLVIEKARLQEEARLERQRIAQENERLDRERRQRQAADEHRLEEQRRELERRGRQAPAGEGAIVPPTF